MEKLSWLENLKKADHPTTVPVPARHTDPLLAASVLDATNDDAPIVSRLSKVYDDGFADGPNDVVGELIKNIRLQGTETAGQAQGKAIPSNSGAWLEQLHNTRREKARWSD